MENIHDFTIEYITVTFCSVCFQWIQAREDCSHLLDCRILMTEKALQGPGSRQSLLHLLRACQLIGDGRTLQSPRPLNQQARLPSTYQVS